jgi:putative hydrolase of the HAD superfamily
MPIETIFFDLDGTLYPEKNGLWSEIKLRIIRYLIERMGFSPAEADLIRKDYLARYGTTLRGLQVEHQVNQDDFLTFVHDIKLENYLQPDPLVRNVLEQIQLPKWIFTNSDRSHANRVLKILDLENLFDGIVDIYALDFFSKPDEKAYLNALRLTQSNGPENSILVDDSVENIRAASKLGFKTVLVFDPDSASGNCETREISVADHVISELVDLQEILAGMPEIP